ncbi:MAG: tRNA adenosine(34) deaminase TadA [Polaromonas sp.]
MRDEYFMSLALDQARKAAAQGEVPVGAVVVRNGLVIATGCNAPVQEHDPTAHAEIVALRAAALAVGNYRLDECEMFVTLEPCAMCSGAMLTARLKRVVFGAAEPKTGAAGSILNLFALAQLNHQTVLQPDVMADASRLLLQDFFRQRRITQRQAARQAHPLRDDALRTPDTAFKGLPDYPWPPHYISDLPALEGLRLHYLDEQGGLAEECVVSRRLTYLCLHGPARWSYEFCRLIPSLLQAGHRVVAPDLIGFGKSDKPKKESFHRFNRHRQIVIELVEKLDLKNIVLVFPEKAGRLALTLPMAATWRFQALRVLNSMESWIDMPLSAGYELWQQHLLDTCEPGQVLLSSACRFADDAAWSAPFPDKGHCAALRAFARRPVDALASEAEPIVQAAEKFWREK